MNRKMTVTLLLMLGALFYVRTKLSAAVGCMDYSQHGNLSTGRDYKKIHFVRCSCPCKKYRKTEKGKCVRCYHLNTL